MVGSEIKELDYNGFKEDKNFEFKRLKNADDLEELKLMNNEIEVIEKIRHLKKLRKLNLTINKIEDFQANWCYLAQRLQMSEAQKALDPLKNLSSVRVVAEDAADFTTDALVFVSPEHAFIELPKFKSEAASRP